jgi:NAD+ kinase
MKPIQHLVIVVNRKKNGAHELSQQLATIAKENGVSCAICDEFPLPETLLDNCDLCCVIGGDGTILGVVGAAAPRDVPVLGVNLGTLGFMANFSPAEVVMDFPKLLKGDFRIFARTLLRCNDATGRTNLALNDIVIKASTSRLAKLTVSSNGKFMNTYYADGLIIATPTGSTAYNLSASGPIVHPEAHVMVLTPINPHTLSNRSIVLDENRHLTIELLEHNPEVRVAADGIEVCTHYGDFPIKVELCRDHRFKLVHPRDYSHFSVLRSKLQWTGDTVSNRPGNP